jgi:Leucine-rich repeat (LRR) protein
MLNLESNEISTEKFSDLENLTFLDLSRNKIKDLPPSISALFNLKHLNLDENQIQSLEPMFFNEIYENEEIINGPLFLERLTVAENSLKTLPFHIYYLSELRQLDLGGNLLTEISGDIQFLEKLTHLILRNNELTSLPGNFTEFSSLF